MNYRFMIDTALDFIRKRYDKRHNPVVGDTVCVICAGNGNIYSASNEYITRDDVKENIHAEITAIRKMQADGQNVIKAITVYNSCSGTPLLPCNGCIAHILALSPENVNTLVITPNGNIPVTEVGRYSAGIEYSNTRVAGGGYSVYTTIPEISRGASLYINPNGGFGPAMNAAPPNQLAYPKPVDSSLVYPGNMNQRSVMPPVRRSVQMPPQRSVQNPVNNLPPLTGQKAGVSAARMSQNGVNNLLKSKLSTLFSDEE